MSKYLFFVLIFFLLAGCASQDSGRAITGSIDDLLNLNKDYRCVLQKEDNNVVEASTIFLSHNKLLNQYEMTNSQGKKLKSQFMTDNDWVYSWYDTSEAQPVKFQISKLRIKDSQTPSAAQLLNNYETKLKYICYGWKPQANSFDLPAQINFQDVTKFLLKPEGMNSSKQSSNNILDLLNVCGQCAEIPDKNLQAECKKSLGCTTNEK